jgi:hypothetical protein
LTDRDAGLPALLDWDDALSAVADGLEGEDL